MSSALAAALEWATWIPAIAVVVFLFVSIDQMAKFENELCSRRRKKMYGFPVAKQCEKEDGQR